MNENYNKGIEILRKMAGAEGENVIKDLSNIYPDLAEKVVSFGFGEIYSRQTLDLRFREIVTLSSLITQGAFEQLDFHVQIALNIGLKPEEILEIVLQCTVYVGFPKAISALIIVGEVFKKNNIDSTG